MLFSDFSTTIKSLHNTEIDNVTVLGATDDETYLKLIGKKCDVAIALDENKVRKNLVGLLNEDYKAQPVNVISQISSHSRVNRYGSWKFC